MAKNELEYGGKGSRGVCWGTRQFIIGDVAASQAKLRDALEGRRGKNVDLDGKSPADVQRLLKMVTIQALRRVDDLLACLGSDNDQIFHRASKVLHAIAETNIVGAVFRIRDADLSEFRDLSRKIRDHLASAEEKEHHTNRKEKISEILVRQLSGIGG